MPVNTLTDFRGFDDWVEVFQAGRQTDSAGRSRHFSEADLDQVIANHSAADAAPIVIGHPKTDDPAYGWTGELKRAGASLFARFKNVEPEFAKAVEAGRYRKRSVRLADTDKGLQLLHVGFLGATPPAVSGLAAMNYATPAGATVLDFEMDAVTPSVTARMFRRLRDWMISTAGLETADRVLPDYAIEDLDERADAIRDANRRERDDNPEPDFSRPDHRSDAMPYSDEDLRRERERAAAEARQAAERDFNQRQSQLQGELERERAERRAAEHQAAIDAHIDAGRLTPAQAAGMAEFMAGLAASDDAQFEFSAPAEQGKTPAKVSRSPAKWFADFLAALPRQVDTGESDAGQPLTGTGDFQAPAGYAIDEQRAELHRKALDYQRRHQGVEYLDAVRIVEREVA